MAATAGWSSDEESGGWGEEDEEDVDDDGNEDEDEDAEEFVSDDEAFIKSLGLGGNKEGLLGDFSL